MILLPNKRDSNGYNFRTYLRKSIYGNHEIKVYSIISQSYVLAIKYFENSWLSYLYDCQILLKVNSIKSGHLLSVLNQISNNIQFTRKNMKKSQTRLPFLQMISRSGTNIWMYIYNKPIDSKRYAPFKSN